MSFGIIFEGTLWSLLEFGLGFIVGGGIDWIFVKFYNHIDPDNENTQRLVVVSLVQLVVIITLLTWTFSLHWPSSGRKTNAGYFVRWGIIMSQFFLLQMGLDHLSEGIYHRREAKGAIKKSFRAHREPVIFEANTRG